MTQYNPQCCLTKLSDDMVFEEAARRLRALYQQDHAVDFLYGTFRFLFHEGRFLGIEACPRNRCYSSPEALRKGSL